MSKAGWGDVGFHNRWCLPLVSNTKLKLKYLHRIAQLSFTTTSQDDIDYTQQTGTYQKYEQAEMVKNWYKESILPKI